jgi:hypothetical protein
MQNITKKIAEVGLGVLGCIGLVVGWNKLQPTLYNPMNGLMEKQIVTIEDIKAGVAWGGVGILFLVAGAIMSPDQKTERGDIAKAIFGSGLIVIGILALIYVVGYLHELEDKVLLGVFCGSAIGAGLRMIPKNK